MFLLVMLILSVILVILNSRRQCNFFVKYRKLAEEELKTNILSTETYQLPSGEEVEKENILCVTSCGVVNG